jgi:pyrimidine-nucleoside phosphorylase
MSKKLAENVDGLVLDVKFGSGAFMRSKEQSLELAKAMVEVGKRYGKKVVALQTNMNQPLGDKIGNTLEIQETIDILAGRKRPKDLVDLVMALGAEMLKMAGLPNEMEKHLKSGAGLAKFYEMVREQGGDLKSGMPVAKYQKVIRAPKSGYVHSIECD